MLAKLAVVSMLLCVLPLSHQKAIDARIRRQIPLDGGGFLGALTNVFAGQPLVQSGKNLNLGKTGVGVSDGFSVAGTGVQKNTGATFQNGKIAIGKNDGFNLFGKSLVGTQDQTTIDTNTYQICNQKGTNTFIGNFGQQSNCVDLGFLKQLGKK